MRYFTTPIGARWDYEIGSIFVMPLFRIIREGVEKPANRPTYIIITGLTYVQDKSTEYMDNFDYKIQEASLCEETEWVDNKCIRRYVLDTNSRICFTWFMGRLRKLADEEMPTFKSALAEAMETFKQREKKARDKFQSVCQTISMWPPKPI